ncbi:MAG: hypothetical protein ACI9X0_001185 [Kiritimatiellia bacterium]|jgi:hypothetical protein
MKRIVMLLALVLTLMPQAYAGEIGFEEKFALADDRAVALKELIPGTPDYYYYHCLHYQHLGEFAKVDELLKDWIKRHHRTQRVEEMTDRQALLTYENDHKKALERIRYRLGLSFNHQKRNLDDKPSFPTRFDQNAISWKTLQQRAFSRHSTSLAQFEDTALDILVKQDLKPDYRRNLLSRIQRPDHPRMAKLVIDDLNYKNSRGFGSHAIHAQLLLTQLDECIALKPDLLKETNFINAYLKKLLPDADVDWEHDPAARQAYYERMWAFVQRLPSSQNSLKAHVLFHRLAYDRSAGVYDEARFMEYIKLPRDVSYINHVYTQKPEHRHVRASLSANYEAYTMLVSVRSDEPLVRDFLAHFLLDADDYEAFLPYIESNYLKRLFAETKVLNGVGDMDRWYSLLSPSEYKALKERIDLEFLPTNQDVVAAGDAVALRVGVKNVEKLIVKTYRINTMNYYRDRMAPITTAIDLDGLVANEEQVIRYKQIPQRRHTETFDFPGITEPGVYVIELIGNGKSSRAVVQKGRMTFAERTGSAGHVFRVFDDAGAPIKSASLWIDGHSYASDADGEIAVPYSTKPGKQAVIVSHSGFSELHHFQHQAENYALATGFYVDRETLIDGGNCKLFVRPQLLLNGKSADIGLLEQVVLTVTSVDSEGISSAQTVKDFELFDDKESIYELRVPEKLASLSYTLVGKVQNLSRAKKDDLSAAGSLTANSIDRTAHTEDMHLRHTAEGYILEILGKTGEARQARPVHLALKHHDFKDTITATLMTDKFGRVALGALKDVDWVNASLDNNLSHRWPTVRDRHAAGGAVHASAGEPITVPYMEAVPEDPAAVISLLEQRSGTFVRDVRNHVRFVDGFVVVSDLDAGDYSLYFKRTGVSRTVRVTGGQRDASIAISRDRQLELINTQPLQVITITPDAKAGTAAIQLRFATEDTRVHVVATRYMPEDGIFRQLGAPHLAGPRRALTGRPLSTYMSGRKIGDEYRYILERKYAQKYPGNMLRRPSLLLNPWSLRKTDTTTDDAAGGEAWGAEEQSARVGAFAADAMSAFGGGGANAGYLAPNLDFLPEPALVLENLRPDAKGVVTVDLKAVGPRQQLHIMAVNRENAVYREVSLAPDWRQYRDLRMERILDPKGHFTEQKLISVVEADKPFVLENVRTSKMEVYDSLAKVHGLLSTLNADATFKEFSFILNWPGMEVAKKRELYSKYACHELSYFLYKKDPAFFQTVIKPYLVNKKGKTFMDHWLLGESLAAYRKPWAHERLNMVERVLLGRAIAEERAAAGRHVKDRYDLIPPNIEHFNHLFKTAIRGSALSTSAGLIDSLRVDLDDEEGRSGARLLSARMFKNASGNVMDEVGDIVSAKSDSATLDGSAGRAMAMKPSATIAPAVMMERMEKHNAKEQNYSLDKKKDASRRRQVRQLYRKLDKTEEWVENNYYHLPIEAQLAELVPVCGFWKDFAAYDGKGGFLSTHVAEASRNFTEMMFAMAVLDLPFTAKEQKMTRDGLRATMLAGSPVIVFHKEVTPAGKTPAAQTLLVSQNFFALNDRYRHEHNERFDKFVTGEFLFHNVYGCQVVLTNPTSTRRKVDVLMQIPKGALPVQNGFFTRSQHTQVEPYSTKKLEYHFYFPFPGDFEHFPVHVATDGDLLAYTDAFKFHVVDKLSSIDKASWDYISQHAANAEVIRYLNENNIDRLNLELIAFRMRDRSFFDTVTRLLEARHVYHATLWSYGIHHDAVPVIREFLQKSPFAGMVGFTIDSPLLTLDPVARHSYQHKEYWPLVNARTYQLGAKRKVLNAQFFEQYERYLQYLRYRPALSDADEAAIAYYMFLQDRIGEGLEFFDRVERGAVPSALQYDYMDAYAAFYRADAKKALAIAKRYQEHPVDRWRNRFAQVSAQAEEITGGKAVVIDSEDRAQRQAQLADTAASLDFKIEDRKMVVTWQNLAACHVNYYLMDIELLFSKKPFVQEISGQFSVIQPNESARLELPQGEQTTTISLPKQYRDRNVMVELVADGIRKSQGYYPHSLGLQLTENYGQLRVAHEKSAEPLPQVYVKVYARMKDGEVKFYKDGYTDLRGRFDYTSLNTNELDQVERFAILIMSEEHGALIREAAPPKR